jgi:hypothetical protein
MKSMFDKTAQTIFQLMDRGADAAIQFVHNHRTFYDAREIHGFYRLETPSGQLLGFRHHCPVNGDGAVKPAIKGSIAIHCPEHKQDVFNPDAAMPVVIRQPRARDGVVNLPNGSRAMMTDAGEWDGEFQYEPGDPGF